MLDDIKSIMERDPAARNVLEVLLLYSGVHALLIHRISHWLYRHNMFFIARWLSGVARFFTGIEIHPGAKIGKGLFIDHGMGVVIGETTEIGDYCTIYQGVTLGGTGKHIGKRHPTIGNNVLIGAGAKVLGPFKVGDNSKIAAGAVVLNEVEEGSTCVGVPAKAVKRDGPKIPPNIPTQKCQDLDHVHIPDPISLAIDTLMKKIERLEKEIKAMSDNNVS